MGGGPVLRRLIVGVCLGTLVLSSVLPATGAAVTAPPAPELVDRNPEGDVGDWFLGATPPDADPELPVLVFVHGLNSSPRAWWTRTTYHGPNDMYAYAYDNGYRTAFVRLAGDKSMWHNGEVLSDVLADIRDYFGVSQVTVVAHSKGGVDTNAASAHFGAAEGIARIITLGSPHWGTPLADLAYSRWTWWLAAILGSRNDATYGMQTGYMNYFRAVTDMLDDPVPYYTLAGNECGPWLSAYWIACQSMSDDNDSVVPVWSTQKPDATYLALGPWDHDEIKMGSRTWSHLAAAIGSAGWAVRRQQAEAVSAPMPAPTDRSTFPGNIILRGGQVQGEATAALPVESGIAAATLTILSSSPKLQATLVGPDGAMHPVDIHGQASVEDIFAGAWIGQARVAAPAPGQWQLQFSTGSPTGYLALLALDGGLQATLSRGNALAAPGTRHDLAVHITGAQAPAKARFAGEAQLADGSPSAVTVPLESAPEGGRVWLDLPAAAGVYNVTVAVTATTADGFPFERTLVTSLAAAFRH